MKNKTKKYLKSLTKYQIKDIVKHPDLTELERWLIYYAYVVNMLWSDYCYVFSDTSYYIKMAKMYLMDEDYPGKADERAYHSAIKRIEYFKNK